MVLPTMAAGAKLPLPAVDKFLPHPGEPKVPFRQWFRLFERFLVLVNEDRPTDNKLSAAQKNTYLYMMLGTEGSRVFDANPAADKIDTTSYTEFSNAVKKQFEPTVSEAVACYDFFRRDQVPKETTEEYLASLRTMAADCEFREQTDRLIAIRMIGGCNDKETQVRLLATQKVELSQVVAMMMAEERAKENAANMN